MDNHVVAFNTDASSTSQRLPNLIGLNIVHALRQLWPSLPALLLQGVVQRLCKVTQPQHHDAVHSASALASWVYILLHSSSIAPVQQQPSPGRTQSGKRKSIGSDAKAVAPSIASQHAPTASQLQTCIGDCLAALPAPTAEAAAAIRQVLAQLLSRLQHGYPHEYETWGSSAQTLVHLSQPEASWEGLPVASEDVPLDKALEQQQVLISRLQKSSEAGDSRLVTVFFL